MDKTLPLNFFIVSLSFPKHPVIITFPFSFSVEEIVFILSSDSFFNNALSVSFISRLSFNS